MNSFTNCDAAEMLKDPARRKWIALSSAFVVVACKNKVINSGSGINQAEPAPAPNVVPPKTEVKAPAPVIKSEVGAVKQDLVGLKLTLDVGHAYKGTDGSAEDKTNGLHEHTLVREQAKVISEKLTSRGATVNVKIYESFNETALSDRGRAGAGSDALVSLHLNAVSNRSVQASLMLVDKRRGQMTADKLLAGRILDKMVAKLWTVESGFSGPKFNQGIRDQKVRVLASVPQSVTACCLTESFFISGMGAGENGKKWNTDSAEAIAEGIAGWHIERANPAALLTGVFDDYEITPSDATDAKLYENH